MEAYNTELQHWGVKGMKWGVRRYQNKDGSLTPAGKKRAANNTPEESARKKAVAKKVAGMAIMTATVATAAVIYSRNPAAVNKIVKAAGNKTLSALKTGQKKAIDTGKKYVREAINSAKDGIKEGIKEAPKKATKAIVTGVAMNTAKRMMDKAVGKEEAARIFKANNGKKIDSFWKIDDNRDKDDD